MDHLNQLLWSANEYESTFAEALASAKGQDLQTACGVAAATEFLGCSLVRIRTDPDSPATYSVKWVHSVTSDPGAKLQVVKVLGLSKNSGSRVSRRIPDLGQLQGVRASLEMDAAALQQAQQVAQQLGLTQQELQAASLRMQLLRVLCDYCEADQKLQQLQEGDTEYLDAEDDLCYFESMMDDMMQQYKALAAGVSPEQQRAAGSAAAAAPAAMPVQAALPAPAAAVPASAAAPVQPAQQLQQAAQLPALPMQQGTAASGPAAAAGASAEPAAAGAFPVAAPQAASLQQQQQQRNETTSSTLSALLPPLPGEAAAAAPQAVPPAVAAGVGSGDAAPGVWLGPSQLLPHSTAAAAAYFPVSMQLPISAPAAAAAAGLGPGSAALPGFAPGLVFGIPQQQLQQQLPLQQHQQPLQLMQRGFVQQQVLLQPPPPEQLPQQQEPGGDLFDQHWQQQQQLLQQHLQQAPQQFMQPPGPAMLKPGPSATSAAAAPAAATVAPAGPMAAGAAAPARALQSLLRPFLQYSRRPKFLTGAEPLGQAGQVAAAAAAAGGGDMAVPAMPGPECRLCYREADTLVWSGRVTWRAPDLRLSGSFAACGHLYPPRACAAAAGTASNGSSSGGSGGGYWGRYRLLPPVLEFMVDVRARDFETELWQQPNPSTCAAPLSAGWDCCPLVLVPGSADDVAAVGQLMRVLRNSKGELGASHIARGSVQVSYATSSYGQQQQQQQHLTGHTFISYNPNGPLLELLQQQLPEPARKHWAASPATSSTFDSRGLLYDSSNPVCLVATSWFAGGLPDPPPGIAAALQQAAAGAEQLKQQLKQQREQLQAAGWARPGKPKAQQQQLLSASGGRGPQQQAAVQQQQDIHAYTQQHQQHQQLWTGDMSFVPLVSPPQSVPAAAPGTTHGSGGDGSMSTERPALPSPAVLERQPRRQHQAAEAAVAGSGKEYSFFDASSPPLPPDSQQQTRQQHQQELQQRRQHIVWQQQQHYHHHHMAPPTPLPPQAGLAASSAAAAAAAAYAGSRHTAAPAAAAAAAAGKAQKPLSPAARRSSAWGHSSSRSRSSSPAGRGRGAERYARSAKEHYRERSLSDSSRGDEGRHAAGGAGAGAAAGGNRRRFADASYGSGRSRSRSRSRGRVGMLPVHSSLNAAGRGRSRSTSKGRGRSRDRGRDRSYSCSRSGGRREHSEDRGRSREQLSAGTAADGWRGGGGGGGGGRTGRPSSAWRSASPAHRAEDLERLLSLLVVDGLSSRERDELRSLLLLHSFAEEVAQQQQGLVNRRGERIQLELACEPSNVVQAVVEVRRLQLPGALMVMPPGCTLESWVRSGGCSLLQPAGPGLVQARSKYMFTARRHRLLARLLGQLQLQVLGKYGSRAVLMLRDVWELVACKDNLEYIPLQLYRMLYRSLVNFLADNMAGGPVGSMVHDNMFRIVPHSMVSRYLQENKAKMVSFRLPNHPGVTRNAQLDSGYIQQPEQSSPAAAAAAAAREQHGDRWIPPNSPESDREHSYKRGRCCSISRSRSRGRQRGMSRSRSSSRARSGSRRGSPAKSERQQHRSRSRSRLISPSPAVAAAAPAAVPRRVSALPAAAAAAAAAAAPAAAPAARLSPAATGTQAAGAQAIRTWSCARLDLSGLRNAERDELRSLALLHSFAAVVATRRGSSSSSGLLELAAEPQELLDAAVPVEELALPGHMLPSSCSLARFVRSYRCGLLVKTKQQDRAWVMPAYMSLVHQHRLLRRLLVAMISHLRTKHHGLTRIYFFRDMEQLMTRVPFYHPLLMYRELYRSLRAFVADTIYLAGEVIMLDRGLVLVPQSAAEGPPWCRLERVRYELPAAASAARDLTLTGHGSATAAAVAAAVAAEVAAVDGDSEDAAAAAAAEGFEDADASAAPGAPDVKQEATAEAAEAAAGKFSSSGGKSKLGGGKRPGAAVAAVQDDCAAAGDQGAAEAGHGIRLDCSSKKQKPASTTAAKQEDAAAAALKSAAAAQRDSSRPRGSGSCGNSSKRLLLGRADDNAIAAEAEKPMLSKIAAVGTFRGGSTAGKQPHKGSKAAGIGGKPGSNKAAAACGVLGAPAQEVQPAKVGAEMGGGDDDAHRRLQQEQQASAADAVGGSSSGLQVKLEEGQEAAAGGSGGPSCAVAGPQQLQVLLAQLDLSGLRPEQQDEARSLALLHLFAAAVAADRQQQQPAEQQGGLQNASAGISISLSCHGGSLESSHRLQAGPDRPNSSKLLQPELASEPQELLASTVALSRLQLPSNLAPPDCTLAEFQSSGRCQLLQLLHEEGSNEVQVQVRGGYMSLVRQRGLLRQLLHDLLTQLEVVRLDDAAPVALGAVQEVMMACYRPLLLYRALYGSLAGFAADMISGGAMVLMQSVGQAASNVNAASSTSGLMLAGNSIADGDPAAVGSAAAVAAAKGVSSAGSSYLLVPAAELDKASASGLAAVVYQLPAEGQPQRNLHLGKGWPQQWL